MIQVLTIGVEKTRAVNDIIIEFIRQELASERLSNFPDIGDNSFDLLIDPHYSSVERDGRYYMELIGSPHVWRIVFREWPYIPTENEMIQARALRRRGLEVYRDAIIAFAQIARDYNLR